MPKAECEPLIVADRSVQSDRRPAVDDAPRGFEESSLKDALVGDRIGKPFRIGAVMFRLLKSYGISDEEIADGIAQYSAKRTATCR